MYELQIAKYTIQNKKNKLTILVSSHANMPVLMSGRIVLAFWMKWAFYDANILFYMNVRGSAGIKIVSILKISQFEKMGWGVSIFQKCL